MAGVIFFRVKKDEEETGETEEDWEVEFREEEDRERGGMPDKIEYRRDMAEVWGDAENNENGIYTDPNDLRTDVRQRESDEMQTVLLTGRQIYRRQDVSSGKWGRGRPGPIFPVYYWKEPGNIGFLPESASDQPDPREN